ncbi:MAG: hypothetical protein WAL29_17100, partial [Bacteroidales bacterium]
CGSGIKGVTYFETAGERGIIQGDYPSRWPDKFHSAPGMIFPVYHIFKYLLHYKSFKVISCLSSDSLKADVLTLWDGDHLRVIVINFTIELQEVVLTGISGEVTIKQLNTESFAEAATDPDWILNSHGIRVNLKEKIILEPFSLSFIDDLP